MSFLLHKAVATGNLKEVKHLIETLGYSPNNSGFLEFLLMTPLAIATKTNQPEMVDYLIEKGANLNAGGQLGLGSTPMELALEHKYTPIVASLLATNATIPHFDYSNDKLNLAKKTEIVAEYLIKAAASNDTDSIKKILQNPYANIYESNFDETSAAYLPNALQTAVKENHFEATSLLLEKGDILQNINSYTWSNHPLNLVKDGQIAELLIKHMPNGSLVSFIMVEGKIEFIPLFVKQGVLINNTYYNGCYSFATPLEAAITKDNSAMIKILVENGASLTAESSRIAHKYATPLEYAAMNGKLQALETLIQLGADLNHKNALNNLTALELAFKAGHTDAVNVLTLHGAEYPKNASTKLDELNPIEMHQVLLGDEIMAPIVDETPTLQNINATISDNSHTVENYVQPINEVLIDEQRIMPVELAVQSIQRDDHSTVFDNNQPQAIYVQPVGSVLGMIEHEQVFIG
jgi:ankyrin repeat protein